MTKWPYPIKAVIFDNDGVLVDTIPIYKRVNSEIIGQEYPDYMVALSNGRSDLVVCKLMIDEFGLNTTPEELSQRRIQMLSPLLQECPKIPGVMRIVKTIKEKGLKMAVATSAKREAHNYKIANHPDLFDNFDYMVCGDEVTQAKPSPEIFLTAAKKICDYDPKNILVFEDAPNGVRAANDAGMPCVFLWSRDHSPEEELNTIQATPTLMISSFDEFDFNSFIWDN